MKELIKEPPSKTLLHYRDSPLTGSPNRCISDFAIAPSNSSLRSELRICPGRYMQFHKDL